jgi:hypothetical protein
MAYTKAQALQKAGVLNVSFTGTIAAARQIKRQMAKLHNHS